MVAASTGKKPVVAPYSAKKIRLILAKNRNLAKKAQ